MTLRFSRQTKAGYLLSVQYEQFQQVELFLRTVQCTTRSSSIIWNGGRLSHGSYDVLVCFDVTWLMETLCNLPHSVCFRCTLHVYYHRLP